MKNGLVGAQTAGTRSPRLRERERPSPRAPQAQPEHSRARGPRRSPRGAPRICPAASRGLCRWHVLAHTYECIGAVGLAHPHAPCAVLHKYNSAFEAATEAGRGSCLLRLVGSRPVECGRSWRHSSHRRDAHGFKSVDRHADHRLTRGVSRAGGGAFCFARLIRERRSAWSTVLLIAAAAAGEALGWKTALTC